MKRIIARGASLATLVAFTGGLALIAAAPAHADDLPDIGDVDGLLGGIHILGDVNAPVTVDGLHVSVLPTTGGHTWGNGILLTTEQAAANVFAIANVTSNIELIDGTVAAAGVPITTYNTWASVLGDPASGRPNGVVVVPNVATQPIVVVDNALDGTVFGKVFAPITVKCTSVDVLSSYDSDCAGPPAPTPDSDTGLLGLGDGVLDLGDGTVLDLGNDGVVDLGDGTLLGLGDAGVVDVGEGNLIDFGGLGVPEVGGVGDVGDVGDIGDLVDLGDIDLGDIGLGDGGILGDGGVLGLGDLDVLGLGDDGFLDLGDLDVLGLIDLGTLALGDDEPGTPADGTPGAGGGGAPTDDNPAAGGTDDGTPAPCTPATVDATAAPASSTGGSDLGMLIASALGGGLAAGGLLVLGRKLHIA